MEKEFTYRLAMEDQRKLIKMYIDFDHNFTHETFLNTFKIVSMLTNDLVVVKGVCGFDGFDSNPHAIFYCTMEGRALLNKVFLMMNNQLSYVDRFRNQLFEGLCYHEFLTGENNGTTSSVKYVAWSYNHLFTTKEDRYKIIRLFCDTLLDALGVNRVGCFIH